MGTGLMGRTHSNGYNRIANFFPELEYRPVLKAVCSRNLANVQAFAEQWGFESYETDWKALVARDDIDAIDICTPNDSHDEIALAAAAAGNGVRGGSHAAVILRRSSQRPRPLWRGGPGARIPSPSGGVKGEWRREGWALRLSAKGSSEHLTDRLPGC